MEIKATRRYLDAACAYARDEKAGRRNRYHPVDTGTHATLIIYRNDSAAKGHTSDSRPTYPSFPLRGHAKNNLNKIAQKYARQTTCKSEILSVHTAIITKITF